MELNFKSFGQGDPVIIMHGMFGTLDNWQTLAKKLAKNYLVYIIDLRNHGKSPHSDEFSYEVMANDVKEFMEANWMFEATIIGHSMGGKVAMQLAYDYPDMVSKLVVVDIAPKKYVGNHQMIFEAMFDLDLETLESRSVADQLLEKKIKEYGVRQFLLKNLHINKETGKYAWKMNLPVIFEQYQHILDHSLDGEPYEGATLFINGGKSEYVKATELSAYQAFFPNATLQTIEEAGHWIHAEKPKELLTILNDFLEED
jgi:pimeloyl-ACP methyl ester carboxylesterase